VQDYCDAVEMFLTAPTEKIQKEIFNIGFQNMSIMDIAKMVKKVVAEEYPEKQEIAIVTTESNDIRSYHINSDKVKRTLGFAPKYTIEDAVRSLCEAFKAGKIPDSLTDDRYYNIRTVKKLNLK
jgi:nucleoside-diphosphate-sugar epimerase